MSAVLRPLRDAEPWFVDRPRLTLVTAAALLAVTAVLLNSPGDLADTAPLLLCLPIALLATTFGIVGGLGAAVAGIGVLVTMSVLGRHEPTAPGWAARVIPLVLLGLLLGDARERLRRTEAIRIRLEEAQRRHRDAVQLNDTIVQSLAAAKWALERSDLESGLSIVTSTLEQSNDLISDLIRGAALRPLWMGDPDHTQERVADSAAQR
jgi:hypothetical protein